MSASAHEAAAARDDWLATKEMSKYDPEGWRGRDCRGFRLGELRSVCWSEPRNPTARHLDEALRRHELAEMHREASKELRDAEDRACAGVPPADREESPFLHREDLLAVEPLSAQGRMVGAEVVFRPVPGLTAVALRKIATCHAARNAVLGHDRPESRGCPLAIPGIGIETADRPDGVVLRLTGSDEQRAKEVLRRAGATFSAEAPPESGIEER